MRTTTLETALRKARAQAFEGDRRGARAARLIEKIRARLMPEWRRRQDAVMARRLQNYEL